MKPSEMTDHPPTAGHWRSWALLFLAPLLLAFDGSNGRKALDLAFHNLYGVDLLAAVELVVDGDGRPPVSLGFAYGRKHKGDEIRTLMFRSKGGRDSDRTLLFQRPGRGDRMFVSEGLHGKVQAVSTGSGSWSLFGSDFAYDDFRAHTSDEYRIEVLGPDVVDGEPTQVLRLRPIDGPYEMMLTWLSTARPVIVRVDYFDRKGLWKRYRVDLKKIRRHFDWWVPMADEMRDLRSGSRTTRVVRNIMVDLAVPDEIFTLAQLSRGRMPSF